MAFGEKFEDAMMTVAEVVGDNKYLMAIKDAFTAFMPFIIIGSMGTLLKVLISIDQHRSCYLDSAAHCS